MATTTDTTTKTEKVTEPHYYQAIGRRREATARVRLYVVSADEMIKVNGKEHKRGTITVNERPIEKYFAGETAKKLYLEPFRTTNTLDRFVISVKVEGGGLNGQMNAFIHGVARALEKIDREHYRPTLKKQGFMTRDPRAKQRRKAGFAQKARKRKQSPKR